MHIVGFIIKIYHAWSPERYFIKQVVAALRYKTLQSVKGSLLTGVSLLRNRLQNTIHGVSNAR